MDRISLEKARKDPDGGTVLWLILPAEPSS
jgi:hypothetical protein